uniref:Neurotransmitter-gated ion-channel transmembrane domain-containing protein n=1 Tax=Meloidogyne enterolobii TaxID=390850 RepID=A0A6V7XW49_MELEN|nr:unnamed protein product [Meloidogyne enterolobii]
MVADITPPTSDSVPIIAAFFSIAMVILGSSIIFTLLIINVHFRSPRTHKMTPWVRTIFLEWLPWLLLMNRPGKQFESQNVNVAHLDRDLVLGRLNSRLNYSKENI